MAGRRFAFAGSFLRPGIRNSQFPWCRVPAIIQSSGHNVLPTRFVTSPVMRSVPAIMRPLVPSQELRGFVEDTVHPRSTILKILNAYVKEKNLQDPNDRRYVVCDQKLKNLFGVERCTILEMSKYITPHLLKPEAVGGKYVEEAKLFEEEYIKMKAHEVGSPRSSKKKKRTRKLVTSTADDMKEGRKLFKPVLLSEDLSAICKQKKEMSRQDIVKSVWEYIRLNNLQGKPGEPIRCDFLLKKVYNSDQVDVKTIVKGISAHVTKIE